MIKNFNNRPKKIVEDKTWEWVVEESLPNVESYSNSLKEKDRRIEKLVEELLELKIKNSNTSHCSKCL